MVENNAYISIGDPYKDPSSNAFREVKKSDKPMKPFQIKQFPENEQNGSWIYYSLIDFYHLFVGYFSRTVYQNHPYFETNLYIESQPLESRKKGFGSKDAHRRDEFSNAVRTQQYRESIQKEMELRKADTNTKMKELIEKFESTQPTDSTMKSKRYQYDMGRSLVRTVFIDCNMKIF